MQTLLGSLLSCVLLLSSGVGQINGAAAEQKKLGGLQVEQSLELGYRFTDVNGSYAMYDSLIDQSQGPRLLEQSFSVRSPERNGALFDDLSINSFGWGGDPENAARMRISKSKWYDFTGVFRRDYHSFDYGLLANPLNPANSNPNRPVGFSPHAFDTTRRMYDFGLTLLPQSNYTVRLGYSRNRANGPSFPSFHEGVDVLLDQPWSITQNSYHIGFEVKILPKTVISYDQFLTYDKNDTSWGLTSFATFLLPTGAPVEFGLPINTPAGQPCASPVNAATGAANPACSGYLSYDRSQRVRASTPTEQLTLSSSFRRASFVARANYSATDMESPYAELFNGFVTRTRVRQFSFSGPASGRRLSFATDGELTVQLTNRVRLYESFRFQNRRIPGAWNMLESETLAAGTPATILSPFGATTVTNDLISNFIAMKTYYNMFRAEYAASKHFGVNVGYKWHQRHVFKAEPLTQDPAGPFQRLVGDDRTVNEHGPLLNVWARPVESLRFNAEVETLTADNFLTRISPRQRQQYRARGTYKPGRWGNLSGSLNIAESRNTQSDTEFLGHYRNYGVTATFLPHERVNLDLSYNFTDALQKAYICFNGTYLRPGTVVNGCPTWTAATNAINPNPNWIDSVYQDRINYFSGTLMVRPVKRLTASLGYGITRSDGNTTILNMLLPYGGLRSTYHQPLASVRVDVLQEWSLNAYWNYDQYGERSFVGPTDPRYFHDNRGVISMRYAF